jgi:hypothetical protein
VEAPVLDHTGEPGWITRQLGIVLPRYIRRNIPSPVYARLSPPACRPVSIGSRSVRPGQPCYIIAEAGSNHNRDKATALRLIEVAAEAGASAVKFQTYTAEGLYSRHTPTMSYLKKD